MVMTDTIASISTGISHGGISIVRISGSESFMIIDKIYKSIKESKILSREKSHTINYGHIFEEEGIVDEVMVSIFRGPNSYTREDIVEINCHGGIIITRKILDIVLKNGARLAEPGEFTKRAFLNGRIDLTQAEAVMELIKAKNELSLKNSMKQLQGGIYDEIILMRDIIIKDMAFIEAALDDPEHMSLDNFDKEVSVNVKKIKDKIDKLIKNYSKGRIIKEGIKTVIVGKPNVGKSSLLNILVGEERAIVTEIAGTTRDILEENININGISLNIIDTAGIRQTSDIVEKIGINKAKESVKEADLVIFVMDYSKKLDENDYEIIEIIKDMKVIILLNKSDLSKQIQEEEIKVLLDKEIINISAKTESGLKELENHIQSMFYDGKIDINEEIYITNERHIEALKETIESLELVEEGIVASMPEDFLSIDLRNAYESLGKIIGKNLEEDLVDTIFSEFCMGK